MKLFNNRYAGQLADALELYYGSEEKHSQDSAAEKLGISTAAFNSRIYTARRRLFECLREVIRPTVEKESELDDEMDKIREILGENSF